ncbi:MAG: hypothetical protein Q8K36_01350 [Alphaproteobacteria bacterium]|nr:hypothetical protein [Alphaproteobacteria bacterium]
METVLTLSIGGMPPLSARGCIQTLTPIQLGKMARNVAGDLIHLGPRMLKYKSTIQAQDKSVIALNNCAPGTPVRVGCIQRLWEKMEGTTHNLSRDFVEGSLVMMTQDQQAVAFGKRDKTVIVEGDLPPHANIFISYRPYLDMRISDFSLKTDEWAIKSEWLLNLEEI